MAVKVINITNISQQLIKILHGAGLAASSRSRIPPNDVGELSIVPGTAAEIEESRVDPGQLETLRRKKLIVTSVR